jgi:hypothetical protein
MGQPGRKAKGRLGRQTAKGKSKLEIDPLLLPSGFRLCLLYLPLAF